MSIDQNTNNHSFKTHFDVYHDSKVDENKC